jgi:hypothetical protein
MHVTIQSFQHSEWMNGFWQWPQQNGNAVFEIDFDYFRLSLFLMIYYLFSFDYPSLHLVIYYDIPVLLRTYLGHPLGIYMQARLDYMYH